MSAFKRLFAPLRVAGMTLPNRAIVGSMHSGLEDKRADAARLATYLAARADAALIVTGGVTPTRRGALAPFASQLVTSNDAAHWRDVATRVHAQRSDARLVLQLLHAGRYAYHPFAVAPSAIRSPIAPWFNRVAALSTRQIARTVAAFARAAAAARAAGYCGVEIMGSEGYLLSEFAAPRTNKRTDAYGGALENRMRFAVETVRAVRAAVGADFVIMYRHSTLDLVEDGNTWPDIVEGARMLEEAGVDILNGGIGWHESRVPTIATVVPHGAFVPFVARLKRDAGLTVPVVASNRINTAERAEAALAEGVDFVSMARPFLADPDILSKAQRGQQPNICIGCNISCLDHVFAQKRASCLVNPRACYELDMPFTRTESPKRVLVFGGGMGGLAAAATAAERGHTVELREKAAHFGGQFKLAARIPSKGPDFHASIEYFVDRCQKAGVTMRTDCDDIDTAAFDDVVVATGVTPRPIGFATTRSERVLPYDVVLNADTLPIEEGARVAIIGAGGIGFDVADALVHTEVDFCKMYGIDVSQPGALGKQMSPTPKRQVTMLQRSSKKFGKDLGKTTGWIHRQALQKYGVEMIGNVSSYDSFDDKGLHVTLASGEKKMVPADYVVLCAGQLEHNPLEQALKEHGCKATVHIVGGARKAAGVDAARVIREGTKVADAI